jgi:hypothetical protein
MSATSSWQFVKTGLYCTVYIVLSGGLINFNKYLIHEGRYPHPLALTAIHMFTNLVIALSILAVKPSLMPGVENARGRILQLYKYLMPIGVFFAIMLYGSNRAYLYCSVAFLQFMKEANVVLVFIFSAMAGLQIVNRQRVFVIMWVILGSSLCVSGELHFVFIGFAVQAIAQFAECMRAVIAELVLSGNDFRLDPLSYTFFVAPICLAVLTIGNLISWDPAIVKDTADWLPCLVPNALIAVSLNISIAQVIKETSAVGFMITGMVKDIVLVCFSSFVFKESITRNQWFAFTITLSGVFFWSYMKIAPGSKMVKNFEAMLGVGWSSFPGAPLDAPASSVSKPEQKADENTPIAQDVAKKV